MGEHQGEVGELTVVILVEEGHWVALSTVRVIGAERRNHRRASVVHELARRGSGGVCEVLRKLRA